MNLPPVISLQDLATRMGVSKKACRSWLRRRDVSLERIGIEDYVFLSVLAHAIPELRESEELAAALSAA